MSSFANTIGGEILYGIVGRNGAATEVVGITIEDSDAKQLQIEDILRTGLEPRVPEVRPRWISLDGDRKVLVLQVPRSWLAPHRVNFDNSHRFWGRAEGKKFEFDTQQLRQIFVGQEALADRVRRFRLERLGYVLTGEDPIAVG